MRAAGAGSLPFTSLPGDIVALTEQVREQNIEVIKTYWDALISGDIARFETLLADDVLVHYPGNHYLSGDYRGKKEVVGLYRQLTQWALDGIFVGEVLDILVGDLYTSVVLKYDLKLPHKTIPGRAIGLFHLVDGKIKEYWLHEWDQLMINRVFRLGRIFRPVQGLFAGKKG
jgi:ketosteroid isomerase-like protein